MYSCLFKWCNHINKDIKKLAFPALEAFLQQVELFTHDHVIQLVIFYCVIRCQHIFYKMMIVEAMRRCLGYDL